MAAECSEAFVGGSEVSEDVSVDGYVWYDDNESGDVAVVAQSADGVDADAGSVGVGSYSDGEAL